MKMEAEERSKKLPIIVFVILPPFHTLEQAGRSKSKTLLCYQGIYITDLLTIRKLNMQPDI